MKYLKVHQMGKILSRGDLDRESVVDIGSNVSDINGCSNHSRIGG